MGKKVIFKSNSTFAPYTEFTSFKEDYLKLEPDVFNNERDGYCFLSLNPVFCQFFVDDQPYFYYRHLDPDKNRFVGISKLGDGPLDYQKGGYTYQLAAPCKNDAIIPYHKISDDPIAYGCGSYDGKMEIIYYTDHATVKESDILQLNFEYFPMTVIDHFNAWPNACVIYQAAKFTGTFEGKPIQGVGRCSHSYTIRKEKNIGFSMEYGNVNMNNELIGIREDGRKEEAVIDIIANGKVWAYYHLEGEEPVYADEVEVEADWFKVPYLNDGTCIYKDIIFRFAGKEIHMTGKWGTKGFLGYPRFEKAGQVEIVGPWYEGSVPYRHRSYMSFNEVQDCYAKQLKELDFNVYEF